MENFEQILEVMMYESHKEKRADPLRERGGGMKLYGSSRTRICMKATNPSS